MDDLIFLIFSIFYELFNPEGLNASEVQQGN